MEGGVSSLVAPVVAVAMPVMADVADASYTNWKEEADVYHLYDDVRTVRFMEAVDASTLKNIVVYDETAKKVVAMRATVGVDPREIKISLASGASYEHNHAYTPTIENVKGLKKQSDQQNISLSWNISNPKRFLLLGAI